jgi:hypothetical protein
MFDLPGGETTFWLLFALFGMVAAVWYAWLVWRASQSDQWPHAHGNVVNATIEPVVSADLSENAGYDPRVMYAYEVAGKTYQGSRLRFGPGFLRTQMTAEWKTLDYRPGRTIEVYYNPARPSDSVLEPGVHAGLALSLGGACALALIGIYLYIQHHAASA